jgi:hypothetical protein
MFRVASENVSWLETVEWPQRHITAGKRTVRWLLENASFHVMCACLLAYCLFNVIASVSDYTAIINR